MEIYFNHIHLFAARIALLCLEGGPGRQTLNIAVYHKLSADWTESDLTAWAAITSGKGKTFPLTVCRSINLPPRSLKHGTHGVWWAEGSARKWPELQVSPIPEPLAHSLVTRELWRRSCPSHLILRWWVYSSYKSKMKITYLENFISDYEWILTANIIQYVLIDLPELLQKCQ